MTNSWTETVLEDRLKSPAAGHTAAGLGVAYRRPHGQQGKRLLRSESFNRLKEFPVYLCRKGSSDVLHWLANSRTRLSSILAARHTQTRREILTVAVYLVVAVLAVEVFCLGAALASSPRPAGLLFLLACVAGMASLAATLARPHLNLPLDLKAN